LDCDSLSSELPFVSHLEPLDSKQTKEYVEWANSSATTLFPEQTIVAVRRHSRGFPRLINLISENALIGAYAKDLRSVTTEIVHNVAQDFRLEIVQTPEIERNEKIDEADGKRDNLRRRCQSCLQ
jgi:hypothetical protein